jgi:lipopolysaccharide exporter
VLAFNVASWPSSLLGAVINGVAMPAFSRVKHDAVLLRKAIVDGLRGVALIVMPMCAVIMALSRPLILTLYGAKWVGAANALSALSAYSAISIICLFFANILGSIGATRLLLVIQIIWLATLAPAMVIGVHHGGIVGAAYAHIVIIGPLVLPCYLFAMKRTTGTAIRPLVAAVIPALIASTLAGIGARAATSLAHDPQVQLLVGLLAGGLIYLFAALPLFLGMLNQAQLKKLRRKQAFRVYVSVARLLGMPVPSGRHAAKRGHARARRVVMTPVDNRPPGRPAGADGRRVPVGRQDFRV